MSNICRNCGIIYLDGNVEFCSEKCAIEHWRRGE